MPDYYGTEAGLEAYAEARGIVLTEGADPIAALIRSSTWIDANWGSQFSGYKTGGRTQLRAFPRTGAYYNLGGDVTELIPTDEIPVELDNATYEGAILEMATPGVLQPIVTPSKAIKKVAIEGAVSVEFANTGTYDSAPVITSVEGILAPLFTSITNDGSGLYGTAYRV